MKSQNFQFQKQDNMCRVNLPLYCNILYEGNNLTKIEFLPFWIEEKKLIQEWV